MGPAADEYEQLQSCEPNGSIDAVVGRDLFLVADDDGVWLLNDDKCVHARLDGEIAAGSHPFVLEDDGLKRLAPNGNVVRHNEEATGRDVVSVLDEDIVAVLTREAISFFDEESLLETALGSVPNPYDGEVSLFVGGFDAVAIASDERMMWYRLEDDPKVFEAELGDRIIDIGFLDEYIVGTTRSELVAFDVSTGNRRWDSEGVEKLGDTGRNRLVVDNGPSTYVYDDGERRSVEGTERPIAESPAGFRRLRRGPGGDVIYERRRQSLAVSIPGTRLQAIDPEPVVVEVANLGDGHQHGNMDLSVSGAELVEPVGNGGEASVDISLGPAETLEKEISVRPEQSPVSLDVDVNGVTSSVSFDVEVEQPDLAIEVTDLRYGTSTPEAELRLINDGPVPLEDVTLSVGNEESVIDQPLPSNDDQTSSLELPSDPGTTVEISAVARSSTPMSIEAEAQATVDVPPVPLTADVSLRDEGNTTPAAEIRVRNEGSDRQEETVRVTVPAGAYELPLEVAPGATSHVLVPIPEPPVGRFSVGIEGTNGLVAPTSERFDGRSPVAVDRTLRLWPDIELQQETEPVSVPRGALCIEALTIENRTDEPLQQVRVVSDGESERSIDTIEGGHSLVLEQQYAVYDGTLPSRKVVVDDETEALSEGDVQLEEGDVVARARIERHAETAEISVDLENRTDGKCIVRGLGIRQTQFFFLSDSSTESVRIPPGETTTVSRELSEFDPDTLPVGETVVVLIEYAVEQLERISQSTATLAPVLATSFESVLSVDKRTKSSSLVFEVTNEHARPITEVAIRYRRSEETPWKSVSLAESLPPNASRAAELDKAAPPTLISGKRHTALRIEATLPNGQTVTRRYEAKGSRTLAGTRFELKRYSNEESTSHEPPSIIRGEYTVSERK